MPLILAVFLHAISLNSNYSAQSVLVCNTCQICYGLCLCTEQPVICEGTFHERWSEFETQCLHMTTELPKCKNEAYVNWWYSAVLCCTGRAFKSLDISVCLCMQWQVLHVEFIIRGALSSAPEATDDVQKHSAQLTVEEAPSPSFIFFFPIFPKNTIKGRRGGGCWQRSRGRREDKKEGFKEEKWKNKEERNHLSTPTIV